MSESALADRVAARIAAADLAVPDVAIFGAATYLHLLARWNSRMNLSALPLAEPIPDPTIDKLIIEPLCAAELIAEHAEHWIDLGSGGGSPAIPLRLTHREGALTMVESRARKCAFLRETVRVLGLSRTTADAVRFEDFETPHPADLISIRAVRLDEPIVERICGWLGGGGMLMCFGATVVDSRLTPNGSRGLPDGSALSVYLRA